VIRRYIFGRFAASVLTALAATLVIFLVAHFIPADPVQAQLGDAASAKPEIVRTFRAKWGLDRPLWEQYLVFLGGLTRGDLGQSIATRRPVMDDILQYAPATIELATTAALLAALIGVPLGILAAIRRDSWLDHLARFVSLLGVSAPTFWLAFIFLAIFYGGLRLAPGPGRLDAGAAPPLRLTGMLLLDSLLTGNFVTLRSAGAHIVLPAAVLAASSLGLIARTTRASMLEVLNQEYVRVASAKGLTRRVVVLRHALPNALIPVVTLGGLTFAQLLTGAVMTETVFSWPGLGRYAFQSTLALDFPAILGITLLVALIYLLVNLVVDVSYAVIDPRLVRA
jgi:peptide/nickel transport system permease protein